MKARVVSRNRRLLGEDPRRGRIECISSVVIMTRFEQGIEQNPLVVTFHCALALTKSKATHPGSYGCDVDNEKLASFLSFFRSSTRPPSSRGVFTRAKSDTAAKAERGWAETK